MLAGAKSPSHAILRPGPLGCQVQITMFQWYGGRYHAHRLTNEGEETVDSSGMTGPRLDWSAHVSKLQPLLTLPRETLPRLTAQEARRYLRDAAERLGLEFVESTGIAPIFLLLPAGEGPPAVTLFQTWHAEPAPVEPAAIEGAERLALGAAIAGAGTVAGSSKRGRTGSAPFAIVVAPAASAGSRGLDGMLREHRSRLAAEAAYWIRVTPSTTIPPAERRRNVFLGARGRVVIALRGGEGNPYRARDAVVEALREEAYGPRPLDFELIRKLASRPEAMALIGAGSGGGAGAGSGAGGGAGAGSGNGSGEERLRSGLFEPRCDIVIPAVPHPDRPRAWLMFETAEAMEAESIASRVEALSGGGRAEVVEDYPWDRANIHHPAIHALIELAREQAGGSDIWPSAPWATPAGLFTRALGTSLAEWGIPLPSGAQVRFPKPDQFEAMALEAGELYRKVSTEGA
jgi:hypothetical protein